MSEARLPVSYSTAPRDLVGLIEAVYQIDQPEEDWLRGLLRSAKGTLDAGIGLVAFTYDASNPASFQFKSFVSQDMPDECAKQLFQGIPAADPDYVRGSFLSIACGTHSEVPGGGDQPFVGPAMHQFGIRDCLVVNGMDANGHGCIVAAGLRRETRLGGRPKKVLAQLSRHFAAAHRLRRRLSSVQERSKQPDAILDVRGKVLHAAGRCATNVSVARLQRAALAIANSRSELRTANPGRAVEEWKGLIAARWTLLEVAETDGGRVLIARENEPAGKGPVTLTERERQVVALAGMGQHNKLIAYTLGISHSTVRVLISRAAAKLGVDSREALILIAGRVSSP